MRARPLLVLLLLAPLGTLPGAVSASEVCLREDDSGGVCVTPDPGCPRATYEPPFEDFAALAQHCLSATPTPSGEARCSHLKAGTYAKPETREVDGTLCVTTSRNAADAGCIALTYESDLARIPKRPLCVLP